MIFICDDFLENPYESRNFVLSKKPDLIIDGKRIVPGVRYYNPSTRIDDSGIGNLILNKTKKITGENLTLNHSGFHFLKKKFCEGGAHYDVNSRYAAVLYLNPSSPNNSGTRIFSHKKNYNFCNQEQYVKSVKKFMLSNNNFLDRFLYKKEITKYEKQFGKGMDVENKFNRLVIYDANYVHKALNFFGNKLENCRLTYFCFMI